MASFQSNFQGFIPSNIILKIFMFLPALSLIRMTFVCKDWCSLIKRADFLLQHFELSSEYFLSGPRLFKGRNRLSFLDYKTLNQILPYNEIPIWFGSTYQLMVSSCNGLVCFTDGVDYGTTVYLFNPFVRKCREIRSSTFDRNFETMFLGFGFHKPTNDHKIIRIGNVMNAYEKNVSVEVYSLSSNSWEMVEIDCFPWVMRDNFSRTPIHDCVNWMVEKNTESMILSFDFGSLKFHEIGLPDGYYKIEANVFEETLFLMKGSSVALAVVSIYERSMFCTIWEMEKFGNVESWTWNYHVQIFREIVHRPIAISCVKTYGIVFEDSDGEMVVWNFDADHISSDKSFEQVSESECLVVVKDSLFLFNDC